MVVPGELVPLGHGQSALVQALVVGAELFAALDVGAMHLADGGDAQADHVGGAVDGVAHEVAVQPALAPGLAEFVRGQGEVVHADLFVPARLEGADGLEEKFELDLWRGQQVRVHLLLVALDPGHVGVGVEGDPVGPEPQDRGEVAGKALRRLPGQPIDQVDVDGVERLLATVGEEFAGRFLVLVAPDGRLDFGGEVLDPHADPVEAQFGERVDVLPGGHPGVDLDGDFGFGEDGEVVFHGLVQLPQLGRTEVGGGPAAPVVLDQPGARRQVAQDQLYFALQIVEVPGGHLSFGGDDDVATAEGAAVLAEGQVDIE